MRREKEREETRKKEDGNGFRCGPRSPNENSLVRPLQTAARFRC